MDNFFVPVILGTARKDRESEKAAHFILEEVKSFGFKTELVDIKDHNWGRTIPPWEESDETSRWRDIAKRANGFIIVTPEYNHGYPGELKMLLDGAYKEYAKKPISVCGVSGGGLGGARVVDHLKQVLIEFQMVPTRNAVYFSKISELFDEKGEAKEDFLKENTKTMLEELKWYVESLSE